MVVETEFQKEGFQYLGMMSSRATDAACSSAAAAEAKGNKKTLLVSIKRVEE